MKIAAIALALALGLVGTGLGLVSLFVDVQRPASSGVQGVCWDGDNAIVGQPTIINGVVTCLNGVFVPVSPAPYRP